MSSTEGRTKSQHSGRYESFEHLANSDVSKIPKLYSTVNNEKIVLWKCLPLKGKGVP
jgi:hypothetical protein